MSLSVPHTAVGIYICYGCLQCLKAKIKRKKPTGVFSTNVRERTDSKPTSSAETSDRKSTAGSASCSSKNAVTTVMEQGNQNKHICLKLL